MDRTSRAVDPVLLHRARSGSVEAFNRLVLEHQALVYGLCVRMLGDRQDAEDTAQEAFLHAYRAIGRYRGEADGFVSWLARVAMNACYDLLRKRQRRPSTSLNAPLDQGDGDSRSLADVLPDPAEGPEPLALHTETGWRIEEGLRLLNEDQRAVVLLYDVHGFTYDEVAAALEIEVGTVKSRLSRARARLRDYLAGQGEHSSADRRLGHEA